MTKVMDAPPDDHQYVYGTFDFAYHIIDINSRDVILLNGFPVWETPVGGRTVRQDLRHSLETALVGEGNELVVRHVPMLWRSGDELSIGDVSYRGEVVVGLDYVLPGTEITEARVDSAHAAWSERTRARWQEALAAERAWLAEDPDSTAARAARLTWKSGGALEAIRAWAEEHPFEVTVRFDNEHGPRYRALFVEAPVLTDTARIVDFGVRLRDLMREQRAEELSALFWHRYDASGRHLDSAERAAAKTDWAEELETFWFDLDLQLDFDRSEISVRSWSGGRIWELYRKPRLPFFNSERGVDMTTLYVAEVEGELKVVR